MDIVGREWEKSKSSVRTSSRGRGATFCLLLLQLMLASCRQGGEVAQDNSSRLESAPVVSIPTITSPATSTHYSKTDTVKIVGLCAKGSTVTVVGADSTTLPCLQSTFSFDFPKTVDGIYSYMIYQASESGTISGAAVLTWIRKTSISRPNITAPATSPFYSAQDELVVAGECETGSALVATGVSTEQSACVGSAFSLKISKLVDGNYDLTITQTDLAGNSASTNFVWRRQRIVVTPSSPSISVMTSQSFSAVGGSGAFTLAFKENQSGGVLDDKTFIYTAGTKAGVVDRLTVRDSLGSEIEIPITVAPDQADHFVLPAMSGDAQVAAVGTSFTDPLRVQIVDRYGNGIPNYGLRFSLLNGDARILSNPRQISDANGFAEVRLAAGVSAVRNSVTVRPASGTLPDLALTGQTSPRFQISSLAAGTGQLGSTFAVGANPSVTEIFDVDRDGKNDVVVLNSGDPSLGILKGQSSGLLGTQQKIRPLCAGANSFTIGDVTGDGKGDVVITCPSVPSVAIHAGNSSGTFNAAVALPLAEDEYLPMAVAIGDFNKDSKADIAIASGGTGVLGVRLGTGTGGFGAPQVHSVPYVPTAVAVGDFDKNGWPDLVTLNGSDNSFSIFLNNGSGGFGGTPTSYPVGTGPAAFRVVDLNEDGYSDLVIAHNADNTIHVLINDTDGGFDSPSIFPTADSPTSVDVRDMNGDGRKDIVVANSGANSISVYIAITSALYLPLPEIATLNNPVNAVIGDLNGDSVADIVVMSNGSSRADLIPGNGTGPDFTLGYGFATESNPIASALADFDEDGKLDLAILNYGSNSIKTYKGNGVGLFTPTEVLATGTSPTFLVARDLNRDGKPDLVVTSSGASTARIYLGSGAGKFSLGADIGVGSYPTSILIGDYNTDGFDDLAILNNGSSSVTILIGVGDGTFEGRADYQVGASPVEMVQADVNNDSEMDLVVANRIGKSVSVLLGNGNATFRSQIEISLDAQPLSLAMGLFNADGQPDIVVLNDGEPSFGIMLGQNNGTFAQPNMFSLIESGKKVVTGDFNADNRLDLLVSHGGSQAYTYLPGSGTGQFNIALDGLANIAADALAVGDVNTDGALDFIVLSQAGGGGQLLLGH